VKQFKAPRKSLGDLDAETAATLITASADLALVLDAQGVIRDLSFGSDELSRELAGAGSWLGQPWRQVVAIDSHGKVDSLLHDAAAKAPPRWRHLNHPVERGATIPLLYTAVEVRHGRTVAMARDMRAVTALQQRLVDAQQSIERDYWRLRHAETRYRLLFQMASEAVLILDASTQKVVEANPAAGRLLGENARRIVGRAFPDGLDAEGTQAVQALLASVRAAGRGEEVRVRSADASREFIVAASLFRQENASLFLVRLTPLQEAANDAELAPVQSKLLKAVEAAPDGFIVTDADGRVLTANRAFLDLVQVPMEDQARGQSLDRWLGRPGVDLSVLISNLRQHGSVRLFATTVRGEYGAPAEVEISGVTVLSDDEACFGFTLRDVGRRLTAEPRAGRELPRSVEQLTELVGRVSLKDLVREATDLIERLCIEAALELTGDNRASAAEMLGLSRQSLYVKLRRYGLGDLATESEG
jgi:transcriptional regulator PpsR